MVLKQFGFYYQQEDEEGAQIVQEDGHEIVTAMKEAQILVLGYTSKRTRKCGRLWSV